jgi:hypothetical protein
VRELLYLILCFFFILPRLADAPFIYLLTYFCTSAFILLPFLYARRVDVPYTLNFLSVIKTIWSEKALQECSNSVDRYL